MEFGTQTPASSLRKPWTAEDALGITIVNGARAMCGSHFWTGFIAMICA